MFLLAKDKKVPYPLLYQAIPHRSEMSPNTGSPNNSSCFSSFRRYHRPGTKQYLAYYLRRTYLDRSNPSVGLSAHLLTVVTRRSIVWRRFRKSPATVRQQLYHEQVGCTQVLNQFFFKCLPSLLTQQAQSYLQSPLFTHAGAPRTQNDVTQVDRLETTPTVLAIQILYIFKAFAFVMYTWIHAGTSIQ